MEVLYPDVKVKLTSRDGNAFSILWNVSKALRREVGEEAAEAFMKEAVAGDYDNLLAVACRYVDVS